MPPPGGLRPVGLVQSSGTELEHGNGDGGTEETAHGIEELEDGTEKSEHGGGGTEETEHDIEEPEPGTEELEHGDGGTEEMEQPEHSDSVAEEPEPGAEEPENTGGDNNGPPWKRQRCKDEPTE
jgi:hypothetical protein